MSSLWAVPAGQGSEHARKAPDPIAVAVAKLQPRLTVRQISELSRAFRSVAYSRECAMPWQLLVAIAFHESSLGVNTLNATTRDHGLMQVNEKTAWRYGLSQYRVVQDAAYSIKFACRLLRENRARYSSRYSYWLGIYRSGTALWRDEIRNNAKRYDSMIRRTASQLGYRE